MTTLDPSLPRLHKVNNLSDAVAYLLAHISWCIDHPHPLHPNRPATPVTELHSLACLLIEFVNSDRVSGGQLTFDHLLNENNLTAAVELSNFRKALLHHGQVIDLPEQIFEETDWWHRMYRFMRQLNKVYLPIFVARHRNLLWSEDTADPFNGVPDPALGDNLRTKFIDIFLKAADIKLAKGSRWQLWIHVNSLEYRTSMIRAATYEIANALCLPTTRLDNEKRSAEEQRAITARFISNIL